MEQDISESVLYRQSLRDKILEVAMTAFAERGIKAVRMDDIASLIGISKRTLYEIYDDKEELLYQGVKTLWGRRREAFHAFARSADSVMDIILELYRLKVKETRRINSLFYIDIRKYPKVVKYVDETRKQSRGELGSFFARGVDEGYFRKDVNYELALQLFDAIDQYIQSHSLIEQFSLEELFGNLLLVSLRGLCTMKGIMVLDEAVRTR